MWGELLCSFFFKTLTKSCYCVSYFFLLLITLYFISSYRATVAGGYPTLVLLKRENNAKRGCPKREIMPCPSCSHVQDRFFQAQQPVGTTTAVLALGNPLLCIASIWKLGFHYCKGSYGLFWVWALAFHLSESMDSGVTHDVTRSGVGHIYIPPRVMKFEEKGQFLPPCAGWRLAASDRWRGPCTESEQDLASSFAFPFWQLSKNRPR